MDSSISPKDTLVSLLVPSYFKRVQNLRVHTLLFSKWYLHYGRRRKSVIRVSYLVDCIWNVMAQALKSEFIFQWNGRVHLKRQRASVQSTTGSGGLRISVGNAGYTMFGGSVKGTGYPLHSPVSPSLALPCFNVCHHISTGFYISTLLCYKLSFI
jgi:hypothetical protein